MDAFEELAEYGQIDTQGYELFVARTLRAARSRGYPPPDGAGRWRIEHAQDVVQELFVTKGSALTLSLLEATSLDSLERLVTTIVQNFLADSAKSTEVGKLRSRLEGLMASDERFVEVGKDRWALADGPTDASSHDFTALARTARGVRGVRLNLPLNTGGPTSRPNVEALLAVAHAVIGHADGAVRGQELTRAVAARFGLLPQHSVPLPGPEETATAIEAPGPGPADTVVGHSAAGDLFQELTIEERRALACAADELTASKMADVLGRGRRQATAILDRAREKVRLATTDEEHGSVVSELVTLIMLWNGKASSDSSSTDGESATTVAAEARSDR
ncbi:hypothetical protein [Promicromonospora sp. NPDC019610]|uniref:hypothetical protein n=1 Tax=Promicromonospora sp. NPDC019610 TaxID=3364405 RepID=UPI00378F0E68